MTMSLRMILASFSGTANLGTLPAMKKEAGPKPAILQKELAHPLHTIFNLDEEEIGFLFWHEEGLLCFDAAPGPAFLLTEKASVTQEFLLRCTEFSDLNVYGRFDQEGGLIFKLRSRPITFAQAPILAKPTLWPVWEVGERREDYKLVRLIETCGGL